jgi:archaeoflavoprotein AfpA
MPLKIVWGITGSGDLISEVFEVMNELSRHKDMEITSVLSKAAIKVVNWYKLSDKLNSISKKVLVEKDSNTPFIVGPLQTGQFDCLLVAPATANTVAKVVNGIADTLITNAISQTNKTSVGIYILPVDQKKGTTTTILPGGKKLELAMRDIDLKNTEKLRNMKGITALMNPGEIKTVVRELLNNMNMV